MMISSALKSFSETSVSTTIKLICATGIIFALSTGGFANARPDPGFKYLICRGGEQMNPIIQSQSNSTRIIVDFSAASNSWNERPDIAPGQCTWVDRAISIDEPRSINFEIPADINETTSWGPNLKAFFLPFQRPVTVRRTTERTAIQVIHQTDGFLLKVMRPNTTSGRERQRSDRAAPQGTRRPAPRASDPRERAQAFETITTFDLSSQSYLTFSVKSENGMFVANRITKGVITGEVLRIKSRPRQ